MLYCFFTLPAYLTAGAPAARAWVIAVAVLLLMVLALAVLLGLKGFAPSRRQWQPYLIMILLSIPLWTSWTIMQERPLLAQAASAWDERDALLRQAAAQGATSAAVPPLAADWSQMMNLEPTDHTDWILACSAAYYGLEKIEVAPQPQP